VLTEVPDQVVGFMEQNNIKTNKVMVDIGSYFKKLTLIKPTAQTKVIEKNVSLSKVGAFEETKVQEEIVEENDRSIY
jgi:hypothetical protein